MTEVGEHPPTDGHLRGVEIGVRDRDQNDGHDAILS
jgi:hypothetical protein